MKILTNEEALDCFADILEPLAEIFADTELKQNMKPVAKVRLGIKRHKKEILEILARIENTPAEEFHIAFWEIPARIVEVLNMPGIQELFTSQLLKTAAAASGAATENIEDGVL